MERENPSAFISYSWDDEEHKGWVLALASRLVENGVDVRLDRWHVPPGASLTQFMEESVQSCDFTIVVCTNNYAIRCRNRTGGVGYEQQVISGAIASGASREKFIPILRTGSFIPTDEDCAIPAHFMGINTIDFREAESDSNFERLLRAIFRQPELVPPPIGPRPQFQENAARPCRLATMEADGWHLLSGVAANERNPKTFHIPSEIERRSLDVGNTVKLAFEFEPDEDEEYSAGERMWVEIIGSNGPYFVGRLRNQPSNFVYINPDNEKEFIIDPYAPLAYDSEVFFLPEHVIDIYPE